MIDFSIINENDIRRAVTYYAVHQIEHPYKESTDYDVIIDDLPYPPVAILGIAIAIKQEMSVCPRLRGGKETACFRKFNDLGFKIVPKGQHLSSDRKLKDSLSWAEYLKNQRSLRNYDPRGLLSKCLEIVPDRSLNLFCGRKEPLYSKYMGGKKVGHFNAKARNGFSVVQVIFGPDRIGLYLRVEGNNLAKLKECTDLLDLKFSEPINWQNQNLTRAKKGKDFLAYMVRIETANHAQSLVDWLSEENKSSFKNLEFAEDTTPQRAINWQPIKHAKNSEFRDEIINHLKDFKDSIINGKEIQFRLSKDGGYEFREHFLNIVTEEDEFFYTNWIGQDPTRFPARVKALALALRDLKLIGVFEATHEDGNFKVNILDINPLVSADHPVQLRKDLLDDLRGESSDVLREVKTRIEQAKLRQILLDGKNEHDCKLCGNKFASEFLVAAHIKPRRLCSDDERLDNNVAMLLCKFGCDELFEKGYLVVDSIGEICIGKQLFDPVPKKHLNNVVGRKCSSWSTKTQSYFLDHSDYHLKNG